MFANFLWPQKATENTTGFPEFDNPQLSSQNSMSPQPSILDKGMERISQMLKTTVQPQEDVSWWNIPGKISSGISSTLTKIIILIVIVAISWLFLISYIQAKAVKVA